MTPPAARGAPGPLPGLGVFAEVQGLRVSWFAPDMRGKPPITGYDVQYRVITAAAWRNHPHSGASTSATVRGLRAGTRYIVRVRARNDAGNSVWVRSAQVTPAAPPIVALPPGAPWNLVVTPGHSSLRLSWNMPDMTGKPPITHYEVQYKWSFEGEGFWFDYAYRSTLRRAVIDFLGPDLSYDVRVRAVNAAGTSGWVTALGIIVDPTTPPRTAAANRAPSFTEGATAGRSVAENTQPGRNIGLPLAATDPDGNLLTYALGGTDAGHFALAGNQLRTNGALDYEGKSSYLVTVTVSDGRGGTDTIAVTITVTNVDEAPAVANRAPAFDEGASAGRSVAENTPAGRNIGLPLAAADPDSDSLTYALGGTDAGHFALAGNQLRTNGALDYEGERRPGRDGNHRRDHQVKSSYLVTVTVSDGRGGTDTIAVTITVTNVDEAPAVAPTPVAPTGTLAFDKAGTARRTVDASAPVGTAVGAPVTATVSAGMAGPFYSVYTQSSPFTVDRLTGQLRTARELGPADEYTILLLATDGKGKLDVIAVIITVTGGAPNRDPVFREGASATRNVVAGASRGVRVGRPVTATDPEGDALFYMVSGTDSSHFSIGSGSGQIKVGGPLTKSSYSFEVVVGDLKGGVDTLEITITVTNVAEAPVAAPPPANRAPAFAEGASAGRSVAENTPADRNIGLPLTATDPDSEPADLHAGRNGLRPLRPRRQSAAHQRRPGLRGGHELLRGHRDRERRPGRDGHHRRDHHRHQRGRSAGGGADAGHTDAHAHADAHTGDA